MTVTNGEMKPLRRLLVFLVAMSMAACGGESNNDNTAGTAGEGGAAGEAGTAGSGGAAGDAGSAGAGGSAGDAGTAGQGGESGAGGEAGAGGDAGTAGQGGEAGVEAEYELITGDTDHDTAPDSSESEIETNLRQNLELTFALHQNALPEEGNGMLSAFSVRQAFAILYPAARGETLDQIADVIGFDADIETALKAMNQATDMLDSRQLDADPNNDLEAVELRTANAFWGQRGANWHQEYLDLITTHLDSGLYVLDFAADPELARGVINAWVEARTETRIKDLLPAGSVGGNTRAVLTNAVYFKAPWATPFEETNTNDGDFTMVDGSTIQVPLMRQAEYLPHTISDELLALEMPFRGRNLVMTLVAPRSSNLADFEAQLDADKWNEIVDNLRTDYVEAVVPKFTFETKARLNSPLVEMGLGKIFTDPDFSGMSSELSLVVSDVFHKTFVAVEEGGAEAAAATAIVIRETSVPPPPELIAFNQPFFFAIRDKETGLILFFGRVVDPR